MNNTKESFRLLTTTLLGLICISCNLHGTQNKIKKIAQCLIKQRKKLQGPSVKIHMLDRVRLIEANEYLIKALFSLPFKKASSLSCVKKIRCPLCKKKMKQAFLPQHTYWSCPKNPNKKERPKCNFCGNDYYNPYSLDRHIKKSCYRNPASPNYLQKRKRKKKRKSLTPTLKRPPQKKRKKMEPKEQNQPVISTSNNEAYQTVDQEKYQSYENPFDLSYNDSFENDPNNLLQNQINVYYYDEQQPPLGW